MEKLICDSIQFYSQGDEDAFFQWVKGISCVTEIHGVGTAIILSLGHAPSEFELRELIALFYRYKVELNQLASFETVENRGWFKENIQSYWYEMVFGGGT